MNLKNLKIGTQLKLGFSLLLLMALALGAVSFTQHHKLHEQTEKIYNHPLQVRRAIGNLNLEIMTIHRDMKNLFLATDAKELGEDLDRMERSKAEVFVQIDILYRQYLGPRSDIDTLRQAFVTWNSMRAETIRLLRAGENEKAAQRTKASGVAGKQAENIMSAVQKIDDFALGKGDEFHTEANELITTLNQQLALLVATTLLLSLITGYILLRNIRQPLKELTGAAQGLHKGAMGTRSSYTAKNEFGELSASFNAMAETIQLNIDLNNKAATLADLMLEEDDAGKFFQTTLTNLAAETGSQLAAAYLLSDDKKTFAHFASIGMDSQAKPTFAADSFEGEFGAALATQEVQHLKNLPHETRFLFHTTAATFLPGEIITIPIVTNKVVAIISLATLGSYDQQSLQLINKIHPTLNSRIEGILAYRQMKQFSAQLEQQNRELESQKTELTEQSTELAAQNSELEMQKNKLDEASRLKTNFLSNMSHELRTPLNSVIALSGVLRRRLNSQIPEEEYSYLEVIERNGKHLLLLINDVLDIARIESGHEEIEASTFNVNTLLAEVSEMINPQARQKGIELLHTESDAHLAMTSDVAKCRHILQNLIGNAVKFTNQGTVTVASQQKGGKIEVTVADTGIGIEEHHLQHIFDEFRQADNSTSRKFGGTGLGLAIAKKYANLLGGTITVKSTPGTGSEFTLTLPLHYAEANRIITTDAGSDLKHVIQRAPEKVPPSTCGKTILLVEDSEPAIIQLRDFLEESGYEILISRNGAEALEIIEKNVPDAIILDLMMPGVDGFEVLQTIRHAERTAHIPVLILSAKHITKDDLKFLKRNNIHQLIQKGDVNRHELQNAVAKMVTAATVETKIIPRRPRATIEGRPVILVVEDNPDNMLTVKALLAENYQIIEAIDGPAGIEKAIEHRPHLILMDIALPGMDGIAAFKTIRNKARLQHVPVIALTASAMTSDRETILAHGFDAYIPKPIHDELFFRTILEVLYGE